MESAKHFTININAVLALTLAPIFMDSCRITHLLDKTQGKDLKILPVGWRRKIEDHRHVLIFRL